MATIKRTNTTVFMSFFFTFFSQLTNNLLRIPTFTFFSPTCPTNLKIDMNSFSWVYVVSSRSLVVNSSLMMSRKEPRSIWGTLFSSTLHYSQRYGWQHAKWRWPFSSHSSFSCSVSPMIVFFVHDNMVMPVKWIFESGRWCKRSFGFDAHISGVRTKRRYGVIGWFSSICRSRKALISCMFALP